MCVAKPVAVELRCHATALITCFEHVGAFFFKKGLTPEWVNRQV